MRPWLGYLLRRSLFSALAGAGFFAPLPGCGPATPLFNPPPPDPPEQLAASGYAVEFVPAEQALRLSRRGEVLLTFPADAIQIGTVDKLDDNLSYDPYWMEYGDDLFPAQPPETLIWHTVTGARFVERSSEQLVVALTLTQGISATLTITRDATGRFGGLIVPAVGATGRAVALMRLRPRVDTQEGFYGLGEWPDSVNHRDKV